MGTTGELAERRRPESASSDNFSLDLSFFGDSLKSWNLDGLGFVSLGFFALPLLLLTGETLVASGSLGTSSFLKRSVKV